MKKLLSIISLVALAMIANAQSFTLTHEGNAISDGQTISLTTTSKGHDVEDAVLEMFLSNTGSEALHFTLKGVTTSANTFSVASVCGNRCYLGTEATVDMAVEESNKLVSVHFKVPSSTENGTTENITIILHNNTTDLDDLTFTLALTYESFEGIENVSIENISNAYPNPATNFANVNYSVEGSAIIVLTDIMGREIMQQPVSGNGSIILNVENLHKGIYLFGIRQGNKQSAMKKLVVK